jgi:hypothetical protein
MLSLFKMARCLSSRSCFSTMATHNSKNQKEEFMELKKSLATLQ